MTELLRLEKITKTFPGVIANDQVDLDVQRGEIHALLGENGSGKTTLMNCTYGVYTPTTGRIFLERSGSQGQAGAGCDCAGHWHGPSALHVGCLAFHCGRKRGLGAAFGPRAFLYAWPQAEEKTGQRSERFHLNVDPAGQNLAVACGACNSGWKS